jgi:hypothetical protein
MVWLFFDSFILELCFLSAYYCGLLTFRELSSNSPQRDVNSGYKLCFIIMYCHMLVIVCGVMVYNWIYWTLITCNYKDYRSAANLHT